MKVTVSNEELVEHKLSEAHLQQTVDLIHNDGYVVLENVVPHHKLDLLRQKMLEDLQTLISAKEKVMPINFVKGHIQQDAPTYAPYIFRGLVANPFVAQVPHQVLGDGLYNSYFSGNTNLPGSWAPASSCRFWTAVGESSGCTSYIFFGCKRCSA